MRVVWHGSLLAPNGLNVMLYIFHDHIAPFLTPSPSTEPNYEPLQKHARWDAGKGSYVSTYHHHHHKLDHQ